MSAESAERVVFLVDADKAALRSMTKALQREALEIATASSGHEALAWLSEHEAELMLLDLELKDFTGSQLIELLTESHRLVPFIVITSQGDERVAVDMMKRGALDYLVKEADFLEFVPEVVRRTLAQLDREKKLVAAEEALRRSEANLAKAQQIAHLGSYDINVPFTKGDFRSDEIFRIIGLEPRETKLSTEDYMRRFVHPADRERYRKVVEESVQEAAPFDFEYRVVRPDGEVRYVHSVGEPVLDGKGEKAGTSGSRPRVVRIVGTLQDITERKRLENALLEVSDREQRRIGQDLHDGLGQHLAGIELMSQVLHQKLAAKKLKAEAVRAGALAKYVRDAISQTRFLARGLVPVVLESEGLMSALQELADNTDRMFGNSCRFVCKKPVLIDTPSIATHLFRIAQEAVTNAIKHSKAKRVSIHLEGSPDGISLVVKDNGLGLPKEIPRQKGMGLRIMQYRASMLGAALTLERPSGGGTAVVCSLASPAEIKL